MTLEMQTHPVEFSIRDDPTIFTGAIDKVSSERTQITWS
jgi:hypothetical protein